MTVQGLPEVDGIATYGGALANYQPPEDPTTDEDAAWRNLYVMNVAGMTHTLVRAMRSFLGNATTPGDPSTGFVHDSVWGSDNGVKPTVVNSGTGIYDLTWPTTVTDELGGVHTINFQRAWGAVESSAGTFEAANAKVTGPNTVRVYTYSGTTLNNLVGEVITVLVR